MFQDYLELLQLLNEHKVKYLIIGGYAVINYAEPRYTKDLDIWVEPSVQNAKKLLKALEDFGAPTDNLTIQDLAKPGLIYVFGIAPMRVDILNKPKGSTFKTAWESKEKITIEKTTVNIIGKSVLIKLKKASGRPQDLVDVEKLKKA